MNKFMNIIWKMYLQIKFTVDYDRDDKIGDYEILLTFV